MIDFYLEQERVFRKEAQVTHMDPVLLEAKIDEMWGHVTLFNCYQFFTSLTSKKLPDPVTSWLRERNEVCPDMTNNTRAQTLFAMLTDEKAPGYNPNDPELNREYKALMKQKGLLESKLKTPVWEGQTEKDAMTVFFNATQCLPKNTMRGLVANADNALKAILYILYTKYVVLYSMRRYNVGCPL